MLPIALGLGLVMLLAVGRGGEIASEMESKKPGGPQPPEPAEPGKELTPIALERKRIIVQKGFLAAEDKRRSFLASQRKTEQPQATKNAVAQYFRSRNVPLDKPNPAIPFWGMNETQIAQYISKVVNAYAPTIVAVGPAQVTTAGYHYPTYVGAGRPRPVQRRGTEFRTAYNTDFNTQFNTAFNTAFRNPR